MKFLNAVLWDRFSVVFFSFSPLDQIMDTLHV